MDELTCIINFYGRIRHRESVFGGFCLGTWRLLEGYCLNYFIVWLISVLCLVGCVSRNPPSER